MRKPEIGTSLSVKQCRNFGITDQEVLKAALTDLGLKRYRLMSYWNECEKEQGIYDFAVLDAQVKIITKHKGTITLCLGARQPRWPESHWPKWALELPKEQRNQALVDFITATVNRYKSKSVVISWQLENEALLKAFGENGDFDRKRLHTEYKLVKQLDPARPVIMSTSTSWGIPFRRPIPDIIGFSYYRITHNKDAYRKSIYLPWIFKLRALLIRILWWRPSFIHELQAEPWGSKDIWDMPPKEQAKSMSIETLQANLTAGKETKLYPLDLWGLEWWYWLKYKKNDSQAWDVIKRAVQEIGQ